MSNAHQLIEYDLMASLNFVDFDESFAERESWLLALMNCYEIVHPNNKACYNLDGWITNRAWPTVWMQESHSLGGKNDQGVSELVKTKQDLLKHLKIVFENLKKVLENG